MDLFDEFAVDAEKATKGVWQKLYGDAEFLLAAADNPEAEALRLELMRQFRPAMVAGGRVANGALLEIECQVLSKTVLLGWKNVTENGEEVEATQENRYKMLRKYDKLRGLVNTAAGAAEPYKLEKDAGVKN